MKKALSLGVYFVFTAALSVLLCACFASAFSVEYSPSSCAFSAAFVSAVILFCVLLLNKKPHFLATMLALLTIGLAIVFLLRDKLFTELEYTVNRVLIIYAAAFPLDSEVFFAEGTAESADALFAVAAGFLSAVFSLSVFKWKRLFPILICAVLLLTPCFISVDSAPSAPVLLSVVALLTALYITAFSGRYGFDYGFFTLPAAVAVMLAVCFAVAGIFPQESYERFKWQDELLSLAERVSGLTSSHGQGPLVRISPELDSELDLNGSAEKENTHKPVMKVICDSDQVLYLRSTSYANYQNGVWSVLTPEQESGCGFPVEYPYQQSEGEVFEVSVIAEKAGEIAFMPYFCKALPEGFEAVDDVYVRNNTGLLSYDVECAVYDPDAAYSGESEYGLFADNMYKDLPDDTRDGLEEIIGSSAELSEARSMDVEARALAVQKYVRSVARYDLKSEKMPDGEDFPIWFLTEAESGYCVHYACAACVLLRAMDVPARYVTGYYAQVRENEPKSITTDNAHAWIEYYDDYYGWIPLECTPQRFAEIIEEDSSPETTAEPTEAVEEATEAADTLPAETQPQTVPQGESPNPESGGRGVPRAAVTALIIAGAAALLFAALLSLRQLLRRRRRYGDNRSRAIAIYRSLVMIKRVTPFEIPEEQENTALRARFGRTAPDDAELSALEEYSAKQKAALKKQSTAFKRIVIWFFS